MYRVQYAAVYRGTLIMRVEREGSQAADRGDWLEVVGNPARRVCVTGSRILFNPDDSISVSRAMFCEPPDFPVEELKGQLLIPSAAP